MNSKKKTVFSGIQPSGVITLGNYLGAIKNWVKMQDDYNCIFFLANMHAITVRQDPKNLEENTLKAYALLLACGINSEKSLFFIQSLAGETHSQLAWILNCYTQFGELSRMTQFKDKSQQHPENINAGLFTYPCLMAADILLYQPDLIPTGKDQKQHVELTRNIAERFNGIYGETFKIPEPFILSEGASIRSLVDPSKKMSKSDKNENACITILDPKDTIIKKFKRAVTDSEAKVYLSDDKPGINNLMTIYSCFTGMGFAQIEKEFSDKGYGAFKLAVGETVADALQPIQDKYHKLLSDETFLKFLYTESSQKAKDISQFTLDEVKRKIGLCM
ncbi:MAG: tryptophan--tRNA ligase [Clostridia bacterium]|nr:tryptophan--tRNA ligase [Clostridia bacterium]